MFDFQVPLFCSGAFLGKHILLLLLKQFLGERKQYQKLRVKNIWRVTKVSGCTMGSGVGLERHMLLMTVLNYCHLCQIGKPRLQDVRQECFTQAVVHSSFCPASAQKLSNRLGPNVYRNRCLQEQVFAGAGVCRNRICRSKCMQKQLCAGRHVQEQVCAGTGCAEAGVCRSRYVREQNVQKQDV